MDYSSAHFDDRRLPISILVMHYTGMRTGQAALEWLCNPQSNVSAHYVVEEDGQIFPLVDEAKRAWHAGKGRWGTVTDVNSASIGIEIVNPGHEWGYRPFSQAQMAAVLQLSQAIVARHCITPCNVIGHSDLAPTRKQDPGELFPWQWLAENGVGVMPKANSQQSAISWQKLADYGYCLDDMTAAITAFQRHFRQHLINEEWDEDCGKRLASLLEHR